MCRATALTTAKELAPSHQPSPYQVARAAIQNSEVSDTKFQRWREQELEILQPQLGYYEVERWLKAYVVRFNLATQDLFDDSLSWALRHSLASASQLLGRVGLDEELMPHSLAAALFCLSTISAKLLTPEAMQLDGVLDPKMSTNASPCDVSQRGQQRLVRFLEMATGMRAETLQASVRLLLGRIGSPASPPVSSASSLQSIEEDTPSAEAGHV